MCLYFRTIEPRGRQPLNTGLPIHKHIRELNLLLILKHGLKSNNHRLPCLQFNCHLVPLFKHRFLNSPELGGPESLLPGGDAAYVVQMGVVMDLDGGGELGVVMGFDAGHVFLLRNEEVLKFH